MILYADYGNEYLAVTALIVSTILGNSRENQNAHIYPFHRNPGPVITSSSGKITNTHVHRHAYMHGVHECKISPAWSEISLLYSLNIF